MRNVILRDINVLLDGCAVCPTRAEMNRTLGSLFARIDGFCNKQCPVGTQLQKLGKKLPRRDGVC